MKVLTLTLILVLAITMALSITLTMKKPTVEEDKLSDIAIEASTSTSPSDEPFPLRKNAKMPSRRVSRFLLDQQDVTVDPVADLEDNICRVHKAFCVSLDVDGHVKNSTCCFPRCVHLQSDRRNCGSCGKLCEYGKICCGGHCVDRENDAEHCGKCHTKCRKKCRYGYCDYAD